MFLFSCRCGLAMRITHASLVQLELQMHTLLLSLQLLHLGGYQSTPREKATFVAATSALLSASCERRGSSTVCRSASMHGALLARCHCLPPALPT